MDLNRISELLRRLHPRQEKVLRLYLGLGCQRPHSAVEIAQQFGVSAAPRPLSSRGMVRNKIVSI
jgi:DNA-directed RNA polymerase sigma subunit (sigma70/sigma32)